MSTLMKREIVLRLHVPRRLKGRWAVAIAAAVLGSAALVYATVPNTFNAGDVLSAQKLNDNFKALVDVTNDQSISGTKTFQNLVANGPGGGWSLSNYGTELLVGTGAVNTNYPTIGIFDDQNKNPWAITNAQGELRFSQMPNLGDGTTANMQRMALKTNGDVAIATNVGIGTPTPMYTLDVVGSARIAGVLIFQKGGNNGTVSCDTFCNGSQWGTTGTCMGAKEQNSGTYYPCSVNPSSSSLNIVCVCSRIP